MNRLASGIDIIEVERFRRGLERYGARFSQRFFTVRELDQSQERPTSLAGRFAVKEAVSKALGTGIGVIRWKDVEIVNDAHGRPELILHGDARRLADELGLRHWSISLSHTATHAVGLAVAMGSQSEETR